MAPLLDFHSINYLANLQIHVRLKTYDNCIYSLKYAVMLKPKLLLCRDSRCGGTLCIGNAFGDGKDSVSPVPNCGIPAILSRAQEADILLP